MCGAGPGDLGGSRGSQCAFRRECLKSLLCIPLAGSMPRKRSGAPKQARHSWESDPGETDVPDADESCFVPLAPSASSVNRPAWEDAVDASSSEDPEEAVSPAGQYINYMTELLLMRNLSAREFCVAMHLAD